MRYLIAIFVLVSVALLIENKGETSEPLPECVAAAEARVQGWLAEKLPKAEIERRYQLALASCAGSDIDSAMAVFVGAVNVDYSRLARMLIARALTPGDYMARVRDRSRKARLSRTNKQWAAAWVRGDADGDLVPDSLDKCPGTKDLAPTGDDGCPLAPKDSPSHVPSADDVHRVLDKIGLMKSRECDGAPVPPVPAPLRMGDDSYSIKLAVSKVTNQPAGCMVFYEVRVDSDDQFYSVPTSRLRFVQHQYSHMVFRDVENISPTPDRLVFVIPPGSTGGREVLRYDWRRWAHHKWQVRAVNGNGLASGWSASLNSPTGNAGRW